MIKYCNLYLPSRLFIIAGLDGLFVASAILLSFYPQRGGGLLAAPWALASMTLAVLVCLTCFYLCDLYDLETAHTGRQVLLRSLRAVGTGVLLLTPLWWSMLMQESSYRTLEMNLLTFVIVLCAYRLLAEWMHKRVLSRERVLLVGSGVSVQLLAAAIGQKRALPLKLRGIVPSDGAPLPADLSFAVCGDLNELSSIARSFEADRIAVSSDIHTDTLPAAELLDLRRRGVRIDDATALYETITGRVPVRLVRAGQMTFGKGFAPSRAGAVVYRLFSFISAAMGLLLTSPLFVFLALLVKLDSKGPVFYKQERVGLNGKTFLTIKFRSIRIDAESGSGPVWATDHDPRVTRSGRILRTLRLDELPQLWNVLRGDMNMVGPRPERPHFVKMLGEHIPYYDVRHSIPPGITGWAQVCASYGANIEESREKLEYDLFYLKNRSLLLDVLIFVKTVKIMISGKGAR